MSRQVGLMGVASKAVYGGFLVIVETPDIISMLKDPFITKEDIEVAGVGNCFQNFICMA